MGKLIIQFIAKINLNQAFIYLLLFVWKQILFTGF